MKKSKLREELEELEKRLKIATDTLIKIRDSSDVRSIWELSEWAEKALERINK